jgi:hypothetical protein
VTILGDTHVPSRAPDLPDWVADHLESADHVIHTGDFDSTAAYEEIRSLVAGECTAVRGNMDRGGLDLPEVATVTLDGVAFVVTHGTGPTATYQERVVDVVRKHGRPDAVGVAGHTHELMDRVVDGVRILNPGSATGASPASEATLMRLDVDDGSFSVDVRRA